MKSKPVAVFCTMCFILGTIAPWAFIVLGAVLSIFATSDANNTTAAYSTAFGLLILATSYLLKRLTHSLSRPAA